jgi:hypothetical protein
VLVTALRRHGNWLQDLNFKLINPFSKTIATSWSKVFEADTSFDKATFATINKLLKDFEDSTPAGLEDRAKVQTEACREEARLAVCKTLQIVRESLKSERKEISRCVAPHVQSQLADGYDQALAIKGKGSVARQKASHIRLARCCISSAKVLIFSLFHTAVLSRLHQRSQEHSVPWWCRNIVKKALEDHRDHS